MLNGGAQCITTFLLKSLKTLEKFRKTNVEIQPISNSPMVENIIANFPNFTHSMPSDL